MEKEDIKKLQESVDIIAKTTVHILENMATRDDIKDMATKSDILHLQEQVNSIEVDLKSFKQETRENFNKVNEKLDDLNDSVMGHDSRIEKLEEKVFAS